jgi:hypothetical protein
MRIHYYLEIDAAGKIRCLKCGASICSAHENKTHAAGRSDADEIPGAPIKR